MLPAEYVLLGEFDGKSVSTEAFKMVRGGTHDALQNLHRIARYSTSTAVVVWTSEPGHVLIVNIEVYILVLLEAREVIESVT